MDENDDRLLIWPVALDGVSMSKCRLCARLRCWGEGDCRECAGGTGAVEPRSRPTGATGTGATVSRAPGAPEAADADAALEAPGLFRGE